MAQHRSHSVAFKRQVSQEYLGGETLQGLSKRHDLSRNLIRIWVEKYQAGALNEDVAAADLLQVYEARIAALERLVGRQALELELLVHRSRRRRQPSLEKLMPQQGARARSHERSACERARAGC